MAAKDFGPIASDYAFFQAQSNEPQSDLDEYRRQLAGFAAGRSRVRLLDFGCGTGAFSERFLAALAIPPAELALTLVEPVEQQRRQAAERLAPYSRSPLEHAPALPADAAGRFDLVLSNHVLYYVENLEQTLGQLVGALAGGGRAVAAIAPWDNPLLRLWQAGFALLGRPLPYHGAEQVAAALARLGARFRQSRAPYRLRFADAPENRLKILRFLFADHLDASLAAGLLGQFDRYCADGQVDIHASSVHFTIEPFEGFPASP